MAASTGIDRRWIFLAMLLAVAIPLLSQKTFPEEPTPSVRTVYDFVEKLPEGSRVLLALDYDASSAAELDPMATAFIRHCCLKRHKMYVMTLWYTGIPLLDQQVKRVIEQEFADSKFVYGTDYVTLGFRPGESVAIRTAVADLKRLFATDSRGNSLESMPITRPVEGVKDMDLILNVSAGYPGTKEWIQFATTSEGIPIGSGVPGVQAPQLYPYIPDQMIGMLAAIKGAAEYEAALGRQYPQYRDPALNRGLQRMGPQLWGHLLMILLIVGGNVEHFRRRWKGRAA